MFCITIHLHIKLFKKSTTKRKCIKNSKISKILPKEVNIWVTNYDIHTACGLGIFGIIAIFLYFMEL